MFWPLDRTCGLGLMPAEAKPILSLSGVSFLNTLRLLYSRSGKFHSQLRMCGKRFVHVWHQRFQELLYIRQSPPFCLIQCKLYCQLLPLIEKPEVGVSVTLCSPFKLSLLLLVVEAA